MSKAQPVVDWLNSNRNQHETPGLCYTSRGSVSM